MKFEKLRTDEWFLNDSTPTRFFKLNKKGIICKQTPYTVAYSLKRKVILPFLLVLNAAHSAASSARLVIKKL